MHKALVFGGCAQVDVSIYMYGEKRERERGEYKADYSEDWPINALILV